MSEIKPLTAKLAFSGFARRCAAKMETASKISLFSDKKFGEYDLFVARPFLVAQSLYCNISIPSLLCSPA